MPLCLPRARQTKCTVLTRPYFQYAACSFRLSHCASKQSKIIWRNKDNRTFADIEAAIIHPYIYINWGNTYRTSLGDSWGCLPSWQIRCMAWRIQQRMDVLNAAVSRMHLSRAECCQLQTCRPRLACLSTLLGYLYIWEYKTRDMVIYLLLKGKPM